MDTTSWTAFAAAEPEFAETVRERFAAHRHHVLGTLRKDGAPRLTGLELGFTGPEPWLGMMDGSRKALDLRRDPRFALYANPGEGDTMGGGDVRISGRAVEVTDPAEAARLTGEEAPSEPFHLFRMEIGEVVRVRVEGDELVVSCWRPDTGLVTRRRH
ncbi:pyridoxamine 5'-phosphate oxidase family protein [Streptomyces sp. NPDC005805]|uniref:pyridoxamine 5'-phosphate oxidase family protein n=1 Tax=Streptomyces sp. NPDC005805 TaxID=3157068 RepID=UPI0033F6FF32